MPSGFARSISILAVALASLPTWAEEAGSYSSLIESDGPIAHWSFAEGQLDGAPSDSNLRATLRGEVVLTAKGPRPPVFPLFDAANHSASFGGHGYLSVSDPGEASILDFGPGDAITMEAWINPTALDEGQQVYIVGKGRTNRPGQAKDNQNYALRLRMMSGKARVSFLYRSAGPRGEYHRWNSDLGILPGSGWHHVAVTYRFGTQEDPIAYVDGAASRGSWDMARASGAPPVVDDDELWIGSSQGGNVGNSFAGGLDEIAIYRRVLSADRFAARYQARPELAEVLDTSSWPADAVEIEIFDGVQERAWDVVTSEPNQRFLEPAFAFSEMPKRYTPAGVIAATPNPYLVRAQSRLTLPAGSYRFVLRAKNGARLSIDGQEVLKTGWMSRNASGHERVPELLPPLVAGMRLCPPSHQEATAILELDGREHGFRLETIVGGKGLRPEMGEVVVAWQPQASPQADFVVLSPAREPLLFTEASWRGWLVASRQRVRQVEQARRLEASARDEEYWAARRAVGQRQLASEDFLPIGESAQVPVEQRIDRLIAAQGHLSSPDALPLVDDDAFLRRLYLDVVGVIPMPDEIAAFQADPPATRRALAIERVLADPRWADPWVAYWQDVLAENPGILKPELNNTGPFRWWIYESFLDNKPLDRFATELVMMEGGTYEGGPAGFAMATQNDAPMAAKAHVLAQAFLGVNLQCARCHDAPFQPYRQEQLFNLAAMLGRQTLTLPGTSTVPVSAGARQPAVEITLRPGDKIEAKWPFEDLSVPLTEGLLRRPGDEREKFAAQITSPANARFAQVFVNRLWHRYLGWALVEPVDDWTHAEPSHAKLLNVLARELIGSGYDVKHVARLVLQSRVYQRPALADPAGERAAYAAPLRRRMTAEQVVDSVYAAAGKTFEAEALTLDLEGRRPYSTFLNLGVPERAWQFTSLSNERDRPALALPVSQTIVDLLLAFGWRDARPHPVTEREDDATVLQPLTMANGGAVHRAVRLSEDSALVDLCLQAESVDELVTQLFLRTLSRSPSADEHRVFTELLSEGFADRRREPAGAAATTESRRRTAVSWSNHLSPEASSIMMEMERLAREGEPPTRRLDDDWRCRCEDALWALLNSPEFVFLP